MNNLRRMLDEWTAMLARTYQQDLMRCKTIEEVDRICHTYGPLLATNPELQRHAISAKNRIHAIEMQKVKSWNNQLN